MYWQVKVPEENSDQGLQFLSTMDRGKAIPSFITQIQINLRLLRFRLPFYK